MQFIYADTLFDSIERLDSQFHDMVSGAIVRYRSRPEHPSFQSHRLTGISERNFWSARVNDEIRLIIYKGAEHTVVRYADHHDAAYEWAERRKFDVNRITGAAQFVAIEERLEEVTRRITHTERGPALFAAFDEEYLLALGVPEQWLHAVRNADESQFVEQLVDELPEEASEALFQLSAGNVLPTPTAAHLLPIRSSTPIRAGVSASSRTTAFCSRR